MGQSVDAGSFEEQYRSVQIVAAASQVLRLCTG